MKENNKIAIIGLGYVGLPLARLFATKYPVIGFDINLNRVQELKKGIDDTFQRTKFNAAITSTAAIQPTPRLSTYLKWWAQMDLNHRPRAYQARALTN